MENMEGTPVKRSKKKYVVAAVVVAAVVAGLYFLPTFGLQGRLVKLNPAGTIEKINSQASLGFLNTGNKVVETTQPVAVETKVAEQTVENTFAKIDSANTSAVMEALEESTSDVSSSSAPIVDILRALYQNLDAKLTLIAQQNARIENKLDNLSRNFSNYTYSWSEWKSDSQSEDSWALFISQWKNFFQTWNVLTQ